MGSFSCAVTCPVWLGSHNHLIMWTLIFGGLVSFVIAQDLPSKIPASELGNVHKASTLDPSVSFRCGLFFADPRDDAIPTKFLPVAPLFILNNSWPAPECSSGGGQGRFDSFCNSIVKPLSDRITLFDPSLYAPHAEKGLSIGDDVCRTLKNKAKAPFVGPPKSKKFPKGIKFGMFTNQCGEDKWNDAELRHHEKACCDNGKYFKCPDE